MRIKWFANLLEQFAILITKIQEAFFARLQKSRFLFAVVYFILLH